MVKFERLSGLWNHRLRRPTGTFFTFFYVFFQNPKNMTFYVFLSCLTRFLEHWLAVLYNPGSGSWQPRQRTVLSSTGPAVQTVDIPPPITAMRPPFVVWRRIQVSRALMHEVFVEVVINVVAFTTNRFKFKYISPYGTCWTDESLEYITSGGWRVSSVGRIFDNEIMSPWVLSTSLIALRVNANYPMTSFQPTQLHVTTILVARYHRD